MNPLLPRPARWLLLLSAAAAAPGGVGCAESCPEVPGADAATCAQVRALRLPDALPPARGNAYADDRGAAQLGFAVFYDARFSSNLELRCASCHTPERGFQDGRATAQGKAAVTRNTPSVLNAAWLSWQTWDGHADSLWAQPLSALENPAEMDFTRLEVAHRLNASYRERYEAVFGALPPLEDALRFPPRGSPGHPAFDGMAPADREAVNRVAANLGKALEAYLRKLAAGPAALDRYLAGEREALSAQEREGLAVFARSGCLACHGGPLLTDERFHNLGVAALPGAPLERGREEGLARAAADPFNALGRFADGSPALEPGRFEPSAADLGAWRTPPLRNLLRSAPYGHNGRFPRLEDVLDFHLQGGGTAGEGFLGEVSPLLTARQLSAAERDALLAFLRSLEGRYPPAPWNNWPEG